jgi:SET domain-containing protein
MSFQYDGSTKFKCNLHCHRCEAINKNGARCKKNTCKMLPTCHIHARSLYGLQVKTSTIPESGLGLFARKEFQKNELIAPYNGQLLTKHELDARYGSEDKAGDFAPYAVQMSRDKYMDCACERGIGSYANAHNSRNNNSRYAIQNTNNTVVLRATKKIREGQEIFVSYGRNYFKPNNAHFHNLKKKVLEEGKRPCAKCIK